MRCVCRRKENVAGTDVRDAIRDQISRGAGGHEVQLIAEVRSLWAN